MQYIYIYININNLTNWKILLIPSIHYMILVRFKISSHQSSPTYKGEILSSKALGLPVFQSQACGTLPPDPDYTTILAIVTFPSQEGRSEGTD